MEQNNNYSNLVTDDVSLTQILKAVFSFVGNNIKYLIISVVIGALLGFIYFNTAKYSYESSMTAYANHLKDIQVKSIIGDLNQMQQNADYESFAKALNIPISTATKINSLNVSINAEIEKDKDEDDAKKGNNFKITATVFNNDVLDTLQNAIGLYLANNPHAKMLKEMNDSTAWREIREIENEIAHLNALKVDVDNQIRNGKNVQIIEPTSVGIKILELKVKIQALKNGLVFNQREMIVLQPFVPFKKQASPRLIKSLISGISIGLILGLILALIQQARAKA
ncbi:Chain length determinant protein [Flexibacter flexilis DSM 6793]|uniref:Chain length determinant protein n=1 Tax=Flexibacter flexilis DSM 6793 TaxID=927664 RepID=A0A1I1FHG8_9BACT|nr:hypothetical protein [Flexibacter flexilis]SFB98396.1 Chain length determinant protein [Flexibacter flexilis DSM 6793]